MCNIFIKYYSNFKFKLITIPKPSLTIELRTCKAYAVLEVYEVRMVRGGGAKVLEGYHSGIFLPYPSPLKKNHGPALARDISNQMQIHVSLPKNKTGTGDSRVVFCQNYEHHHFRFPLYFRWMSMIGYHPQTEEVVLPTKQKKKNHNYIKGKFD